MATRQPLRSSNENVSLQPSGLPKPKSSGLPKPSGLARPISGLPKPSGIARPAAPAPPAAPVTNGKPPVVQKRKLQTASNMSSQPAKRSRLMRSNSASSVSNVNRMNTSGTSNATKLNTSGPSGVSRTNTSGTNRAGAPTTTTRNASRPGTTTRATGGAAANKAAVSKPPAANGKRPAWDLKGRIADMETFVHDLKSRNNDLQGKVMSTDENRAALEEQNSEMKHKVQNLKKDLEIKDEAAERLRSQISELENSTREESRRLRNEIEDLTQDRSTLERKTKNLEADLDVARQEGTNLKMTINTMTAAQSSIKAELEAIKATFETSERENREKATLISQLKSEIVEHKKTIADQESEIRDHEMDRRKLHNTIQELKGNIRVFCRVRPLLGDEALGIDDMVPPHIVFPDAKESKMIELEKVAGDMTLNESSITGLKKGSKYAFSFDKVFTPKDNQPVVFEEIQQLVQSSLDGYNVCIFAYGQTGSGKTFTMEGYDGNPGMIPRAVEQIFQTSQDLASKGWEYEFEASFLEIYNDMIRDLLSKNDNLKHEVKMVPNSSTQEVYVTNLTCTKVADKSQVDQLLTTAADNRAVAETKCNARSSRSHSVFRLRITGKNTITHNNCVATLNLVDLAGSERLKDSGSEGDRLKETKAINKSLANLGNVIMALANKDSHIPYRNCKLTHLLQYSLGGNSKCLMFVNVAPKEECFNETLNTLRFATKVNNCNIGTAQRVTK